MIWWILGGIVIVLGLLIIGFSAGASRGYSLGWIDGYRLARWVYTGNRQYDDVEMAHPEVG